MSLFIVFGVALSLSLDAFAVSVSNSCTITHLKRRHIYATAFSFALFQASMPILGFYTARGFKGAIDAWDHWIAFALLAGIGGKMLYDAFSKSAEEGCEDEDEVFSFRKLLLLSIATSIDAFAVGISFSLFSIPVFIPALIIGLVTFVMSSIGSHAGRFLRHVIKDYAEKVGGIILILIGLKILLDNILPSTTSLFS